MCGVNEDLRKVGTNETEADSTVKSSQAMASWNFGLLL